MLPRRRKRGSRRVRGRVGISVRCSCDVWSEAWEW